MGPKSTTGPHFSGQFAKMSNKGGCFSVFFCVLVKKEKISVFFVFVFCFLGGRGEKVC